MGYNLKAMGYMLWAMGYKVIRLLVMGYGVWVRIG
jgi:hypothetical protein